MTILDIINAEVDRLTVLDLEMRADLPEAANDEGEEA